MAVWITCIALLTLAVAVAAFWGIGTLRWTGRRPEQTVKLPPISILVAGRNEQQYVVDCLRALVQLDYPAELLDVVFIDDHSTDRTRELADKLAAEFPRKLTVLAAPECPAGMGPKKNAIMHGVRHARGQILLFTDADCRVKPGWAKAILRGYDRATGAVTGPVLPPSGPGFVNLLLRLERILISYTSASAIGWGHPASASGGNFSYRREAFEQLGGIAHTQVASGDDDLMAQAIARNGWSVGYASGADAVVEHLRIPTMHQEVNATIRHQSTARYYPVGWRIAYALSILLYVGIAAAAVASIFVTSLLPWAALLLLTRLVIEGLGVATFCRRSGIAITAAEYLIAEICLPFYLLIRTALSLFPSFTWQARTHHTTTVPTTKAE